MNDQAEYRIFDLAGTHAEIGRALGQANRRFSVPAWWAAPPPLDLALACFDRVGQFYPPLLDEYRAFAEAQGLAYADLVQLSCRVSLRARAVGGCSSFARRASSGMWAGRNYDFRTAQRGRQRIRLAPRPGWASVGMAGSVPGGRYDGVNEHGLFVSLHVVMSDQPSQPQPGIPFHLVPRILLETCADLPSALDLIQRMSHLNSFNYLLADPSGMAVVETHPERVRVRWPAPGADWIDATNHYRHPEMAGLMGNRTSAGSRRRAERLAELASAEPDSPTWAQRILQDHAAPLCEHRVDNCTLWSVVAHLTGRQVAFAFGPPCRSPYEPVAWPSSAPASPFVERS